MKIVKFGHGNTLPEIGRQFFLQTGFSFSSRRVGFLPVSFTNNGQSFTVHYSVRSAATFLAFELGQVWEVKAVKYHQLRGRDDDTQRPGTLVRLDLLQAYDLCVGWFDPHSMTWNISRYERENLVPISSLAAKVQYTRYTTIGISRGQERPQAGYFPEVVNASSGAIIVRYTPYVMKFLANAEVGKGNLPSLPDDGAPLTRERNIQEPIEFIIK